MATKVFRKVKNYNYNDVDLEYDMKKMYAISFTTMSIKKFMCELQNLCLLVSIFPATVSTRKEKVAYTFLVQLM